jgi:Protein of unknown function (DUF938)
MSLPYSPACDRNRDPILAVLRKYFADRSKVLEIGSGTGQHAVYFTAALSHLQWQPTERISELAGLGQRRDEAQLLNLLEPLALDVNGEWPTARFDAAFTANTLHIMSWTEVEQLFLHLNRALTEDAVVAIYGPFNYDGRFTSESNEQFDRSLKARGAHMGIRDFEKVNELAAAIGLQLVEDVAMPANNRTLVWRRR